MPSVFQALLAQTAERFPAGLDAKQLDAVWMIVKVRRDILAHVDAWILDRGDGHIVVTEDKLKIAGLPDFGLLTWLIWVGVLRSWTHHLVREEGFVAIGGPARRPARLDLDNWPDWATRGGRG